MTGSADGDGRYARLVVGSAVEDLVARRLGRILVPLALLFLLGVAGVVRRGLAATGHVLVACGALAAAGAVSFGGLTAVWRALGRVGRWRPRLAAVTALLPYVYALYVLAFSGLRPLARPLGDSPALTILSAALYTLLGGRLLWLLPGLSELQTLAGVMAVPAPQESAHGDG